MNPYTCSSYKKSIFTSHKYKFLWPIKAKVQLSRIKENRITGKALHMCMYMCLCMYIFTDKSVSHFPIGVLYTMYSAYYNMM